MRKIYARDKNFDGTFFANLLVTDIDVVLNKNECQIFIIL